MIKNLGSVDKGIRIFLAVVLTTLYLTDVITGTLGLVLIGLSVLFVLTSLISFCPVYLPFGLSTLRRKLHS